MRDRATATLTTLIVDDESLACEELAYLLKDFPEIEVAAHTNRTRLKTFAQIPADEFGRRQT